MADSPQGPLWLAALRTSTEAQIKLLDVGICTWCCKWVINCPVGSLSTVVMAIFQFSVGCDTRFVLMDDGSSRGIIKIYLQW